MPDLLNVTYARTGQSTAQDALGMREMQARAYAKRDAQYLLLKAPPASGKSRALMFIALDKVLNQGLDKVIVSVPEMSIGGSFRDTDLTKAGFFADWHVDRDLCTPGTEGKVEALLGFLADRQAHYLVCTHATLRFAYERLKGDMRRLDRALIAIDEFHHVSADEGSQLGALVDDVMANTSAHIVAMTGSYFRGDQVPILQPAQEARFTKVTYTYYEQLNGYKYLKSLGLGYHFYQGKYLDALGQVLDPTKKTIIHIPSVNSGASTGQKLDETDKILDILGHVERQDERTGIITLKAKNGRTLKVADLVTPNDTRANVLRYLREIKNRDDMDIIIALGMAKEGFDWPWCEHVLTIGYRASMTEVVQIIGRATRDCEGKEHAQFTNLIAQPDAQDKDVRNSVNNLLKAITLSLLMRDVLLPRVTFRPRSTMKPGEKPGETEIVIEDKDNPLPPKVREILANGGLDEVITQVTTSPDVVGPALASPEQAKVVAEEAIPKIIATTFPDLAPAEVATVHDLTKAQLAIQMGGGVVDHLPAGEEPAPGEDDDRDDKRKAAGDRFVRLGDKFLNVDDLSLDLIDQVNPFQDAYEILSKAIDAPMLKTIQDVAVVRLAGVSEAEAVLLWPNVTAFREKAGREPNVNAADAYEKRLAEVLAFVRAAKARRMAEGRQ